MSLKKLSLVAMVFFTLLLIFSEDKTDISNLDAEFERAKKLEENNRFQEAFDIYEKRLVSANSSNANEVCGNAVNCLYQLNRSDEIDAFLERILKKNETNPALRIAIAKAYISAFKYGWLENNQFRRGYSRNNDTYVSTVERDRVRALQILEGTKDLLGKDSKLKGDYHITYAETLMSSRSHKLAWALQDLTDLSVLPKYDESNYRLQDRYAPADKNGNPVIYEVPTSFEKAENDGQRWRFHLEAAKKSNSKLKAKADYAFAYFLLTQWGSHTLYDNLSWGDYHKTSKNDHVLETLSDNETLCKLATGIKRFDFPEGYNFIKIFKSVANSKDSILKRMAIEQLGYMYENRRQFSKVVTIWETALKTGSKNEDYQKRLNQIKNNWGHFVNIQAQPAGEQAQFQFKFRNASKVSFTAFKVDLSSILNNLASDLNSEKEMSWSDANLNHLVYSLVEGNRKKYVSEVFKSWDEALSPRPDHFDSFASFKTPFSDPGAYLIKSKVENGNENFILLILSDTMIVQKELDKRRLIYVADFKTGKPLANMNVECFGYYPEHVKDERRYRYRPIQQFTLNTNENGFVASDKFSNDANLDWLIVAKGDDNRFAYSGFQRWYGSNNLRRQSQSKIYGITDRPIYKPSQTVHFKFWDRVATYEDSSEILEKDRDVAIQIHSQKKEVIFRKTFKTDEYGGISGSFELPSDVALGSYRIVASGRSHLKHFISFHVEEYKKPEFEVKVQVPEEAVRLGETFKAKIEAKYYFGAPVTKAKVKYKVLRTEHDFVWRPIRQWDWLYGNGYGWFFEDYEWYPGWERWRCGRPRDWWWHRPTPQPEVVIENEVAIDEDGTAELIVETKIFKELYGDKSQKFQIIAEVVEAGRRTIVGQRDIIVANQPFKVFTWLDKGYYNEGDKAIASFQARTVNGASVKGVSVVSLYEITYNKDLMPIEKKIHSEKIETDLKGKVEYKFNALKAGQYRLSFEVENDKGEKEEGAVVFTVFGGDLEKNDVRFNDLEILTKEIEYRPDDLMNLKINTNAKNSTVLLFLRPQNGVYQEPEVLALKNKSFDKSVLMTKSDMPNFFVEALTVRNGKIHVVTKEIVVPPENKALNVEIIPDLENYKPGQESVVNIKVTDMQKKPFQGSLVVSVYDKAIEYISGGGNTKNIKDFYWKMKRKHTPKTVSNLDHWFYGTYIEKDEQMHHLGKNRSLMQLDGKFRYNSFSDYAGWSASKFGEFLAEQRAYEISHQRVSSRLGDEYDFEPTSGPETETEFETPTLAVRKDFADLAYWNGDLITDLNGMAQIKFKMPENLTTWKINSWVMGANVEVGHETKDVITTKDILIRLQAPRFFVEKDEAVLSGIVHNYLKEEQKIKVVFEQFGDCLSAPDNNEVWVTVPSNGKSRVDWHVKAVHHGETRIRISALSAKESDSIEMKLPVLVHGIMKRDSFAGVIKSESDLGAIVFKMPEERKPEDVELVINYTPSLAGTIMDALPYLVGRPSHGSIENALKRFIPTVITQNIFLNMNLDLEIIKQKRANLKPIEKDRSKKSLGSWNIAGYIFDKGLIEGMTKEGVENLYAMQNEDGGWSWFFDNDRGRLYAHTTATVVHWLRIAEQGGAITIQENLERGLNWLKGYQEKRVAEIKKGKPAILDDTDALVYKVLVENKRENVAMRELLMRDKSELSAYGLCLMGMGFHALKLEKELKEVIESIEEYLGQDEDSQTAWLNVDNKNKKYWDGSKMETNALYLNLLAKTMPRSEKASRLVTYLLNNELSLPSWKFTRDTALCIEAIFSYWQERGELNPSQTVEIWVDGKKEKTVEVNNNNVFDFDNSFRLAGEAVTSGKHIIELRKIGKGALYYNAFVRYFSKEAFIPKAGLELRVDRKIYKLVKGDAQQMAQDRGGSAMGGRRDDNMKRVLIDENTILKSGDLLEVDITVDSNDDYRYLYLEDPKVAGFETVEMKGGYNAFWTYIEYKSDKVVMFIDWLRRGKYTVSYKVRAEIPGKFSALPTQIYSRDNSELRGNSDENKIIIVD